jgi:sulfite oxidase
MAATADFTPPAGGLKSIAGQISLLPARPLMPPVDRAPSFASRRRFLELAAIGAAGIALRPYRPLDGAQIEKPAKASHGNLTVLSADPLNAEPPLAHLVAAAITPVADFYVRSHGPIPTVPVESFRCQVAGMVNQPQDYALAALKEAFQLHTVEATLTCAGNRREELSGIKQVGGVQWAAGAIGNARWTGVRLADLLKRAGLKEGAKHVWFEGLDPIKEKDGSVAPFGGSIPLEKALADDLPALVAFTMNDQPLSAEHGYPLRTVVPGYIGARSVKWLRKITVSDRPSPNHYLAAAYKLVQTDSPEEAAAARPIFEFPINAAICLPASGTKLKAGTSKIAGYALPSGEPGCTIEKVEVSGDGGKTWSSAKLEGQGHAYTWQLWSAELDLPAGRRKIVCRATDSRGHTMPQEGKWNAKGYLFNGWHSIAVDVA